jgi:hypothetical protein
MRGIDIGTKSGRRAASLLALAGAFAVSGCDPTAELRKPELATCQRFIRSGLRVPSSFNRSWYNISDLAVTRDQLAKATGDAAQAKAAPNPAIRRVIVNYRASDGLGTERDGVADCLFPMTDGANGTYAHDTEALVDKAVIENVQKALALSTGDHSVVASGCCTVPAFDVTQLNVISPQRRNQVKPQGRKL